MAESQVPQRSIWKQRVLNSWYFSKVRLFNYLPPSLLPPWLLSALGLGLSSHLLPSILKNPAQILSTPTSLLSPTSPFPDFLWRMSTVCKKNSLFYQTICHPLRLLKIPQVAILGDLHCSKGSCFSFQILVQPHYSQKLPTKLRSLTHPPSLLANRERLRTSDLGKSQVGGRYNCIRDVRRSHCRPSCAHVSAQLEWVHACTLLIKRNCLVNIFCLSCLFSAPEGL
jgi:hypothetical protein